MDIDIDSMIAESAEKAQAEEAKKAAALFGDLLCSDIAHVRKSYAKLAIEGRAPGFKDGVEKFFTASEKGERKEVKDVDITKAKVVIESSGEQRFAVLDCNGHGSYRMRRHAFGQLAREMGAPPGYLVTLPPTLALDNLAWGFKQIKDDVKKSLRVEGGEIRAIVSGRYAPLDDRQACALLYAALEQAGRLDEAQIESWASGTASQMTVTFGDMAAAVDKGYALHGANGAEGLGLRAGITMKNAELGNGSLGISAAMWRHWCSNGAIIEAVRGMEASWARRHMGDWKAQAVELADALLEILKTSNEVLVKAVPGALADAFKPEELQDRIKKLGLTRLERKAVLRTVLSEALGMYRFEPAAVGLANTAAEREAADVMRALEEAKKEEETNEVLAALRGHIIDNGRENGAFTAWDLVNGITATARDHESPERAAELEALGGKILAEYLH